jgi:hypothetical protein
MTGLVTAAPHNSSMIDIFARRSKVATVFRISDSVTYLHTSHKAA